MTDQPDPRRCIAHSSVTGLPCRRWARLGTTCCPWHGGNAPQVKAAGLARWQADQASRVVARRLARRSEADAAGVNPGHVLLGAVRQRLLLASALEELVDETGMVVKGKPSAAMELFLRASKEAADLAKDAARLGLDIEKLNQLQARKSAEAWRRAIRRSGVQLSDADRQALASAFAEELGLMADRMDQR